MKLYSRKLHSVEELRKEKQMLRRKVKKADQEDLFSFEQLRGAKSTAQQPEGSNRMGDIISAVTALLGSGSVLDGALAVAPLAMRMVPGGRVKKVLFKAVKEFAGGYLKWKGIEIGFRFVKRYIASRKQKRNEEKLYEKEKQR